MTTATARRTKKTATAAAASTAAGLPLPALLKGEIYIGAIIGPDGRGEHVILLPGDQEEITWKDALAWAKKQGGDLPNRVEQALLFAHHKKEFTKNAYWSNTQGADDERYAWCQGFYWGDQGFYYKDYTLRARAVRRVPV